MIGYEYKTHKTCSNKTKLSPTNNKNWRLKTPKPASLNRISHAHVLDLWKTAQMVWSGYYPEHALLLIHWPGLSWAFAGIFSVHTHISLSEFCCWQQQGVLLTCLCGPHLNHEQWRDFALISCKSSSTVVQSEWKGGDLPNGQRHYNPATENHNYQEPLDINKPLKTKPNFHLVRIGTHLFSIQNHWRTLLSKSGN